MNSEELEQSLRTEFENYLRNTIAEMKQEVSDFEQKIQSEFEKHKSHLDEAFQEFSEKFGDGKEIEESFRDSVAEHLKLAREEGSKITADAFAEAEKLSDDTNTDNTVQFANIRDAINEISNEDSQSEILKSLVHHATQFTPRGAFFIVKNEHLVGWRMFGTEEHSNPQVVREVFFPVASKTALSEAVQTLASIEGSSDTNEDNLLYLNKLGFEKPEKMYAIPLVARGRGVAVLYADNGTEGESVNVEALETLMRVAGLTVEVLASTQTTKTQSSEKSEQTEASEQTGYSAVQEQEVEETQYTDSVSPTEFEQVQESETSDFQQNDFSSDYAVNEVQPEEVVEETPVVSGFHYQTTEDETEESEVESTEYDFQPVEESVESPVEEFSYSEQTDTAEEEVSYGDKSWESPVQESVQDFSATETEVEATEDEYQTSYESYDSGVVETDSSYDDYSTSFESEETEESSPEVAEYQSDINQSYETPAAFETTQFDSYNESETTDVSDEVSETEVESFDTSYDFETSNETSFDTASNDTESVEADETEGTSNGYESVEEHVPAPPVRPRFGDRNVDLPIEVTEDERRLHNDARRFARLLVSEIKLYNEQKVKEGRDSSDLYERLREAIDRSREMYDKRVQPPVAAKFDYFNYELVNTLAEGDEGKLGVSYPGAVV